MNILLCNDDGIFSEGIFVLWKALSGEHDVITVAPMSEQSASSHSITLHEPVRLKTVVRREGFTGTAVNGTPADCVKVAFARPGAADQIDCVVSGINRGHNTSNNIFYSGTVSAAAEGGMAGKPALAVSAGLMRKELAEVGEYVLAFLDRWANSRWFSPGIVLNLNYPDAPGQTPPRMEFTRQGKSYYETSLVERSDPHGNDYYWFTGRMMPDTDPASDDGCLAKGCVSVTPLRFDLTDEETLDNIKKAEENFWKE